MNQNTNSQNNYIPRSRVLQPYFSIREVIYSRPLPRTRPYYFYENAGSSPTLSTTTTTYSNLDFSSANTTPELSTSSTTITVLESPFGSATTTPTLSTVSADSAASLNNSETTHLIFNRVGERLGQAPNDPYGFLLNRTNSHYRDFAVPNNPITTVNEGLNLQEKLKSTLPDTSFFFARNNS